MVSRGETSRHRGHFRIVFYRSKCASCYSGAKFCHDVRLLVYHVDVHFILYFTHQDASPVRGVPAFFGYGWCLLGFSEAWVRPGSPQEVLYHGLLATDLASWCLKSGEYRKPRKFRIKNAVSE